MSVADVAQRLMISPAKLSRLETAARPPQLRDVRDLCNLYGVKEDMVNELLALARGARERGWWQQYDLIGETNTYLGLEASAMAIHNFESTVIPGLLQTDDYARGVIKALAPTFPGIQPDEVIKTRGERQHRLLGEGGPDLWFVIDESALSRGVGSKDVMPAQVARLLEVSEMPSVTLQVLPFSAGAHAALQSQFVILELPPETGDVVFIEDMSGFHFLERPEDLRRCRRVFDLLRAAADGPDQTRERLRHLVAT